MGATTLLSRPRAVTSDPAERLVGRAAAPAEHDTVADRLTAWGAPVPQRPWRVAVVASAGDETVAVAVAHDTPAGTVASVAVHPEWTGLGVGRFLGRLLGLELLRASDDGGESPVVLADPEPWQGCRHGGDAVRTGAA